MNTPIYDFVTKYNESRAIRFHMPGHKGIDSPMGIEHLDITEFDGADNLWDATGIIKESEENASSLFGAKTFYSTEGSSLCIRAMLFMIKKWAYIHKVSPFILAARNAHKTFINAAAILDINIDWLMQKETDTYESCTVTGADVEAYFAACKNKPVAVYITSPDYLGNMLDIQSIADSCHRHGVFLICDNAHGAYLKFMNPSAHPMDLGADICCDSAHKTLPALTGAAYLHVSHHTDSFFAAHAKEALSMFASTSPSYLILQSLDLTNAYLSGCSDALKELTDMVNSAKKTLVINGFKLKGSEPLKITIDCKAYGYTGNEIANILISHNIYLEYHDDNYIVAMITTKTSRESLDLLIKVISSIPACSPLAASALTFIQKPESVISPSEAIYMESETIPSDQAVGRVLAESAVSCPPCVPVYIAGEVIDRVPDNEYVCVIKQK